MDAAAGKSACGSELHGVKPFPCRRWRRRKDMKMRLLVVGATGGVGMEIVKQAMKRQHDVTAFARSTEPLQPFASKIRIVQGDLLNLSSMEGAVRGHDAVLS